MTDKMIAERRASTGRIVFNNPERRNAVSLEMWEGLQEIMDDFERDDGVKVIVLTGAGGKAFVSGADISEFRERRSTPELVERYDAISGLGRKRIRDARKPTIAMIRGYCMGGGLSTALACDLRIASDDARFGIPAAKLGIGYGYEHVRALVDVVGPANALEMLYTGRQFDAREAFAMGLVNRVVDGAGLEAFVDEYCAMIAGNAPLSLRAAATVVRELRKDGVRDLALCEDAVTACFNSADYVEGRTAFMEKRKPVFTGK
jgi:enoyl-CoA hydratase